MIYVLYHASCRDGFGAAWAAHKHLGDEPAKYIPVQYGDPVPEMVDPSRVYVLDFSYDAATLASIADRCEWLVVLDHHKTAKETLENFTHKNAVIRFDMEKSGAVLAWEWFHPEKPIPMLLRYVQDRDLWTWKLPWTREVSAALDLITFRFDDWTETAEEMDGSEVLPEELLVVGGSILEARKVAVNSLALKAYMDRIGGHIVPVVNSPLHQSEIGERLCELHPDAPFAAVFFVTQTEEIWSLRSRNGFDVSAVAKSLGGGGHQAAAGFKVPRS